MSTILLIIFIVVGLVITPIIKSLYGIYRLIRQYRRQYSDFAGAGSPFGASQERPRESRGGWTYPMRRKKKVFAKDEGEYIDFKEVKVSETTTKSSSTTDGARSYYSREQQVTDVEWEEIG